MTSDKLHITNQQMPLDEALFPLPTPTLPTPGTDEAIALEMMLKNGWVGPDEFHAETGSHRLAAFIGTLKKQRGFAFIKYVASRPILPRKPHRTVTLYSIDFSKINLPMGAVGASHE